MRPKMSEMNTLGYSRVVSGSIKGSGFSTLRIGSDVPGGDSVDLGVWRRYRLGLRRKIVLRWSIPLVFLLATCLGAMLAHRWRGDFRRQPDFLTDLIWLNAFITTGRPNWNFWRARKGMGELLYYALPRTGEQLLIWSGGAVVFMAALLAILAGFLGTRIGWGNLALILANAILTGSIGYYIAAGLGCDEFRTRGILKSGLLIPWSKLGKFEWMSESPPILRIKIAGRGFDRADVRIECPDDPEINGILVEHGLVRW
jgi:hypothetical protein